MKGVGKWLWMMTVLATWVEVNGCLEQEKAALLQLKQNLGDQFPLNLRSEWLASWKKGKTTNCCGDWEGVTCGLNSRVVYLSLKGPDDLDESVKVHFNASVLHPFEELRELNLTDFNIKSWDEDKGAPKLSSKLKSLELLNLRGNNFDVSSLSQLRGFSSLKYLFLDGNNLEGLQLHDIEAISQNLEKLSLIGATEITGFRNNNGSTKLSSSLKVLDLSDNMLDNNIISQLSGFQSLHTLYLEGNNLRGIVPLEALHQLKNLEELYLSSNYLITGITNCNGSTNLSSSLKILDLAWNELDNNIYSQLFEFQSLHTLKLDNNHLRGNVPIDGSTKLSSSLKVLDLSGNMLDNNIISQLSGFQSLHTLYLRANHLRGIVPLNALHQLKNLEELYLDDNSITGITNCNGSTKLSSSLKVLDLSENMLDNNIISQLSGFQSLHTLYLGDNQLRGVVQLKALHQLKNLEELDLSSNLITGITNCNGSTNLSSSLKVLDLSNNKLDNNIISQLSGLPSLHTLNLGDNQLRGNVPINALHQLRNLEVLDLSGNEISGLTNYNATFSGGQTSLQELDLSYNQLAGGIPTCLQNLTSLETLDLSHNQLIGNIGSSPLIHLLSLKYLILSYNHLLIPDSFQSFANHTKLEYFFGDSNKVVHEFSEHDAQPPFPIGPQLQALSLSNCALFTYPPFLRHQRELRFVDLSDNLLQGEFPTWLLENNLKLDTLLLINNSLESLQLPSVVHAYISRVWVAKNKIQGNIPANIGVIYPNLVELDLSYNKFKGNIPLSLVDLHFLKGLYLSNNLLSGEIHHLTNSLESLDLSNNAFEGELPNFSGLLSLSILHLQGNKYSSGLQKNKFGPSLEVLNLSNNSLEGHIPNDIYNSSQLSVLDLSYNRLNGLLPKNFSSNIQTLKLNDNRLIGHVTDAFCNSFSWFLTLLDLSNNELRGRIPAAISNLTGLEALFLRGNQFIGQIPFQLCLVKLSLLDLSSNNLYGPIPSCLSQLFTSGYFDGINVNGMHFELINDGRVGELISMKLDSAHNIIYTKAEFVTKNMDYNYEGRILSYMSGIDLSCNKLTGHIPHELGNLSNIQTLNLSHNQLGGVIPSSFSNLKNIESLDLSYNHLNGRIPAEVTSLDTLEVFNVSYNNLSGRIPLQGHSLTFDDTSYKGNLFLCGLPLLINCTKDDTPSTSKSESQDEDSGWIDMEAFYITFAGSGVTMFLAVVIIMLINPHWWNAWFYLAKACILYSYYFFEDNIRKLRRARRI